MRLTPTLLALTVAIFSALADDVRVERIDIVDTGYGFEHAWEIVPGTWTIEISHAGTKLAEQSFTVTE